MSFPTDADRVRGEPLAAAFGLLLSPWGNIIATACKVNATPAARALFAFDVAVAVAMQSALSEGSAGGT